MGVKLTVLKCMRLLTMCLLDDITEMYSKLRSLVLEYLGIPATPIKQSSDVEHASCLVDDVATGLTYSERRGQSAPLPLRRLWSHPGITDSSDLTTTNIPKSPLPARGVVVSCLLPAATPVIIV